VNTGNNTFLLDDFDDVGNATGVDFRILSNMRIYLEGAYRTADGQMTNTLQTFATMPTQASVAYAAHGYAGTESVGVIPNADVVDWILVEVRDAATPATATSATVKDVAAGFLLRDGSIVGLDGSSPLPLKANIVNNAYFVIIHRNHIKVMTSSSPSESFGNYTYDFTDNPAKAYGTNSLVQVDTSPVVYGMFTGDIDVSTFVNNADKVPVDQNMGFFGYHQADVDFSAFVNNADKVYIDLNMGESSSVPW